MSKAPSRTYQPMTTVSPAKIERVPGNQSNRCMLNMLAINATATTARLTSCRSEPLHPPRHSGSTSTGTRHTSNNPAVSRKRNDRKIFCMSTHLSILFGLAIGRGSGRQRHRKRRGALPLRRIILSGDGISSGRQASASKRSRHPFTRIACVALKCPVAPSQRLFKCLLILFLLSRSSG